MPRAGRKGLSMFEHFGWKDVWFDLKRHWKFLLVALAAAVVILGVWLVNSRTNTAKTAATYESTASFYIALKPEEVSPNATAEQALAASKNLLAVYKSSLTADFCKKYILEKMLKIYSPEELIKAAGLGNMDPKDLTIETLAPYLKANAIGDTPMLNIFVQSKNAEFSEALLGAYISYITKELPSQLSVGELHYLGGVNRQAPSASVFSSSISLKQLVKYAVVAVIAIVALYCISVFLVCLCAPTLNRKSDFAPYGIPVIGEVNGKKTFFTRQS